MKPTGKRPLGRPRQRWEDNIRKDPKEIDINTRNWVDSVQDTDYWSECGNQSQCSISHLVYNIITFGGLAKQTLAINSLFSLFFHRRKIIN